MRRETVVYECDICGEDCAGGSAVEVPFKKLTVSVEVSEANGYGSHVADLCRACFVDSVEAVLKQEG